MALSLILVLKEQEGNIAAAEAIESAYDRALVFIVIAKVLVAGGIFSPGCIVWFVSLLSHHYSLTS